MTPSNDLDRRLTDFLADGPSSATERSIVFALDHAAAHPRRRDVLSVVRRDPMRSPAFAGPMRVLPLAAALALLVPALAAVAFVGGAFNQPPVVVPPPIVSAPLPLAVKLPDVNVSALYNPRGICKSTPPEVLAIVNPCNSGDTPPTAHTPLPDIV